MNIPFVTVQRRNIRLALHPDWKRIGLRAWSMRFVVMSSALSGVDSAMTYLVEGRFSVSLLVFATSIATGVARVVHQDTVSGALPQRDGQ